MKKFRNLHAAFETKKIIVAVSFNAISTRAVMRDGLDSVAAEAERRQDFAGRRVNINHPITVDRHKRSYFFKNFGRNSWSKTT